MNRAFAVFLSGVATMIVVAGPARAQAISPAQAACKITIESAFTNWIIQGYDPFGNSTPSGTFDMMFRNDGGSECRFYPLFETEGDAFGLRADGGGHVTYTLFDNFSHTNATPFSGRTVQRATERPVIIPAHGQQLIRYTLDVNTDELPGDGLYSQRVFVEAQDQFGEVMGQRQVLLGINVVPSATIGLAGSYRRVDGRADIDLGELTEGTVPLPLQLNVQATRGYRLQARSENGWRLRMAGTQWQIPYRLSVGSHDVTSSAEINYSGGKTSGMRRDALPMAFSIGDVKNYRAGSYSDVVTVSVSLI